jgi:tricorn protease
VSPRRALPTLLLAAALAAAAAPAPADAQDRSTKLLRFPDVHGDQVAFVYAGDVWLAPADGGRALRLTSHPGIELFPKFSPDGEHIAFTGQYDGDEQVYVVPTAGGVPKQLTFYPANGPLPPRWGYDNQVYGWTADGTKVLFRSMRHGWDLTDTQLFTVSVEGGLPTALPMPISGAGDYSPDETRVVYSPLTRDFRSWKRYQGGWAQDLYVFDLENHEIEQITDHPRTDRDPMWIGDRIYFASDRTGTLNLYAHDLASGATEQLTRSTRWDVRWPSDDGESRIVYELGGELEVFDVASGESRRLAIQVPTDALPTRPSRIEVAGDVEDLGLSPKGERAVFVARGDVFSVPIEKGAVRNLTATSGAHDKAAAWSPDGSRIAFLSDASGEEQLYLVDQDGSGEAEQLTTGFDVMLYAPRWSPDGEKIALSDKTGRLYVVTVESKEVKEIADSPAGFLLDHAWAPDSAHLAFSLPDETGFSSIYVWRAADGEVRRVTAELFNEFSPAWGPNGDYLYYLADRSFAPQIGSFEFNYVVDRESGIYALALRDDVPPLLPPESDEVTIEGEEEEDGEGDEGLKRPGSAPAGEGGGDKKSDKDEDEKKPEPLEIDWDGLATRVVRIPVAFENYQFLVALPGKPGKLLYAEGDPFYYGRFDGPGGARVHLYDLEEREAKQIADGVQGGAVSDDGTKLLARQRGSYKLYEIGGGGDPKTVSTDGLEVWRDPKAEWEEIFAEVWRRFRDFFYVENMHGYDWQALREQYEPLLEHVGHRSDLNYLISEMIAELNVSHSYIAGGDYEVPDRPPVALPGARFELDPEAGRYRIAHVFPGDNQDPKYRAPLAEIGVDAKEGDYVLAIDGEELTGSDSPYRLLRFKADRPVELTVNSRPSMEGSRTVSFEPIRDEDSLIYLDWVTANRERVDRMTDGRVGYLHIPDMGGDGIWEFIKHYYGQIRKEGLVIDVRNNGGGNVSAMLIERLQRTLLAAGTSRNSDFVSTYPGTVFHGHLVCVMNENSASDGDIFPAMFQEAGLGPLIGKRTWGGVIGISGRGPLIDGGQVFVPEFGFLSKDGEWIIEGWGVEPDIEVENDPKSLLEGRDPQLERAVEEVLRRIEADPRRLPERPADPVRTQGESSPPGVG